MNELLHPRLIARVERSLKKRLNTDVRPHLMRFAALARSEDEFLSAAARLLINPREREEWLAAWASRAQEDEGPESAPMPLDTTSPAPLDTVPANLPTARSFRITPAQLARLRDALAHELGPIASVLIDTEAARSESAGELVARLQAHLDDEIQRTRFVNSTVSKFHSDI
jgi:hypothetical protein